MNGVCKIKIALAGLEGRGGERKAGGIRGIILTFVKAKKEETDIKKIKNVTVGGIGICNLLVCFIR